MKFLVGNEIAVLEVLFHPVHGGAALLADERGDEVVSALEGPFQDALGVGAGPVRHVVGRQVRAGASRCPQTDREAPLHIQQRFGNVGAVIRQRQIPFAAGLRHQFVVCLPEQFLKIDQMFQIFHLGSSLPHIGLSETKVKKTQNKHHAQNRRFVRYRTDSRKCTKYSFLRSFVTGQISVSVRH